ncbi:MAG TPA: polysaccharide deacetylase family protein [Gemmatimonadaceae bacterium]|nr:polysaccharide deacetylase family protein [Gemmatimonadaceae bacterium]
MKRPRPLLSIAAAFLLVALLLAGLRQLAGSRTVQLFGRLVAEAYPRDSLVALTFDDGPADAVVDSLIEVLRAHGAQATFFLIGRELAESPEAGQKLVAAGHELGRTTVMWSVEPDSYPDVAATPEGIVRHVLERARPGSIVILHPWYPSRRTSRAAIGPLVDSLHARGYRVVSVGRLLDSAPDSAR